MTPLRKLLQVGLTEAFGARGYAHASVPHLKRVFYRSVEDFVHVFVPHPSVRGPVVWLGGSIGIALIDAPAKELKRILLEPGGPFLLHRIESHSSVSRKCIIGSESEIGRAATAIADLMDEELPRTIADLQRMYADPAGWLRRHLASAPYPPLAIQALVRGEGAPASNEGEAPPAAADRRAGPAPAILRRPLASDCQTLTALLGMAMGESRRPVRVLHRAASCENDKHPIEGLSLPLQHPRLRDGSAEAARGIFAGHDNVEIAEQPSGIIRITIADPPADILRTPIKRLSLKGEAPWNAELALLALLGSKDVREEEKRLGIEQPPATDRVHFYPMPRSGDPRLPPVLEKLTLDEALDQVARTFGGILTYVACPDRRRYTLRHAKAATARTHKTSHSHFL
jgi:hypothetical protein